MVSLTNSNQNHTTETALLEVANDILMHLDKGGVSFYTTDRPTPNNITKLGWHLWHYSQTVFIILTQTLQSSY